VFGIKDVVVESSVLTKPPQNDVIYLVHQEEKKKDEVGLRTFLIVLIALVVTFNFNVCCNVSENSRLFWMLGSHVRRVFFLENGLLFP
jgi:hypothetical protein